MDNPLIVTVRSDIPGIVAIGVCLVIERTNADNVIWNLLYVNNFLPFVEQFMPWTWSLAVEEQFYLTLPLVLLLMFRLKRFRGAYLACLAAKDGIGPYLNCAGMPSRTVCRMFPGSGAMTAALPASGANAPAMPAPLAWWHPLQ